MFRYFFDRAIYDAVRASFRGLAKERAERAEEKYRELWEAALPELVRLRAEVSHEACMKELQRWLNGTLFPAMKPFGFKVANELNHRVGADYNRRLVELSDERSGKALAQKILASAGKPNRDTQTGYLVFARKRADDAGAIPRASGILIGSSGMTFDKDLKDLVDAGLLERSGSLLFITDAGREHLAALER